MAKKAAKRIKHVPQRTCVGCRQTLAKRALIRIVRTSEGLRVDPTGKLPGRGAYLHDQHSCWESGLKGALAHALKVELTGQDRETLRAFMNTLPKEEEVASNLVAQNAAAPNMAAPNMAAQGETLPQAKEIPVKNPRAARGKAAAKTAAQPEGERELNQSAEKDRDTTLGKAL